MVRCSIDDDSISEEGSLAPECILSSRNVFSTLDDDNERDRDDPHALSDLCLRELMGKVFIPSLTLSISMVNDRQHLVR